MLKCCARVFLHMSATLDDRVKASNNIFAHRPGNYTCRALAQGTRTVHQIIFRTLFLKKYIFQEPGLADVVANNRTDRVQALWAALAIICPKKYSAKHGMHTKLIIILTSNILLVNQTQSALRSAQRMSAYPFSLSVSCRSTLRLNYGNRAHLRAALNGTMFLLCFAHPNIAVCELFHHFADEGIFHSLSHQNTFVHFPFFIAKNYSRTEPIRAHSQYQVKSR